MASSNTNVISLRVKLVIDTKGQRVLFAEAGKEFVDFLFTLLSLPIGSVIRLLSNSTGMVGSLGKLYKSIEDLSDTYLQPNLNKDNLLIPKSLSYGTVVTPLLLPSDGSVAKKVLYTCGNCSYSDNDDDDDDDDDEGECYYYVTDDPRAICPRCEIQISTEMTYVAAPAAPQGGSSSGDEGGYVKGVVTYMVMDDLEVKPMSTISSITLLKTFNVNDIADLEEKMVSIGMDEGLKLLKASLESKNVLTNAFLGYY